MSSNRSIDASQPESGPVRYLLLYNRWTFDVQTQSDTRIIQEFAKHQNLNFQHVVHLGTNKTDRRVHIVFDYNNLGHCRCPIRSFKGKHQKPIRLNEDLVEYLHSCVDGWKAVILAAKAHNAQFPYRSEVYRTPVSSCATRIHQIPAVDCAYSQTESHISHPAKQSPESRQQS